MSPNVNDTAPIDPRDVRLDLIRGDLAIELSAASLQLSLAGLFLETRRDDLFDEGMESLFRLMRSAHGAHKKLKQERADKALDAEAAAEFRRDRDRDPKRRSKMGAS